MNEFDTPLQRLARFVTTEPAFAGVHVVGGALRNALLGRAIADIDLGAPGDAAAFARAAAEVLGTHAVVLGDRFPLYRLPVTGGAIDIAPMRGSIIDDLAERDFTVNAMALPLEAVLERGLSELDAGALIDPYGGRDDLARGMVRLVSAGALIADPVRALRAVRIACEAGLQLHRTTRLALADPLLRAAVALVAAERNGAELQRIFASDRASLGVRSLDRAGLLTAYFPALEEGRDVDQRPVHRYPVLEHQLVALEMVDVLLAPSPPAEHEARALWSGTWDGGLDWDTEPWGDIHAHLRAHALALRLATLLHDVGKPGTRTVEADGRTRFFGHAERGARLATDALTALRMPSAVQERVALLVDQHLRPGQIASPGEPPTSAALHRFHRALGDATPDVCFLFLADSLATVGADRLLPRWPTYVAHVHRIVTWRPPAESAAVRRLVDGHAVMRATGLPPGPRIGHIIAALDEAAATGEVSSMEQALDLARTLALELPEE